MGKDDHKLFMDLLEETNAKLKKYVKINKLIDAIHQDPFNEIGSKIGTSKEEINFCKKYLPMLVHVPNKNELKNMLMDYFNK